MNQTGIFDMIYYTVAKLVLYSAHIEKLWLLYKKKSEEISNKSDDILYYTIIYRFYFVSEFSIICK